MKVQHLFPPITIFTILVLFQVLSFAVSAAEIYEVDPVHSSVTFRVKYLGIAYVYGRFNNLSGTLTIDDEIPPRISVDICVNTEKVDTFNWERDEHLRSPDFFNAEKFRDISFKGKSNKIVSKDRYEVAGKLDFHGVARQLKVEVDRTGAGKDPWGGYRIGFESTFAIKRSDFEMRHMIDGVSDEVVIIVSVEGIRR